MQGNCTTYGIPDDGSRYNRPLPAVGLYIAGASFICFLGLSVDLYRSLRRRKLWVASSTFPLNAATLTLLAVATKLPSDITTAMPGAFDQLTKLSSIVLICVVMNHVMPSLGLMSGAAVASNVVALGILVVTVSVNVWIQLYTGVVSSFTYFNLLFTICMMLMFFLFVSHALAAASIMRILEEKYDSKHRKIASEMSGEFFDNVTTERLVGYLNKYWLMALTSSPDYVMHWLTTSIVSSSICHGTVTVNFIQAAVTLLTNSSRRGGGGPPCLVLSAYSWSIPLVFSTQAVAIAVGTVVSVLRAGSEGLDYYYMVRRGLVRTAKFWVQILVEWKEMSLPLENRGKLTRKIANTLKNSLLLLSIRLQIGVLILAKAFFFIGGSIVVLLVLPLIIPIEKLVAVCRCPSSVQGEESQPPDELIEYVLQLEDDEEVVPPIKTAKRWWKNPQKWMAHGRGNQPNHLLTFLKQRSEGSTNMAMHKLMPEELPECWALCMVTLATIASTAMQGYHRQSEQLLCAVREGLRYARFVEKNLYTMHSKRTRMAADMVWDGIDLYHRWLDMDLDELVTGEDCCAVKKLKDCSGQYNANVSPLKWPPRMLAAYCMNKAAGSILLDVEGGVLGSWESVLGWLEGATAAVLQDCLRHLPHAIIGECYRGRSGDREEGVREAALVLGEAEQVLSYLNILQPSEVSSSMLG